MCYRFQGTPLPFLRLIVALCALLSLGGCSIFINPKADPTPIATPNPSENDSVSLNSSQTVIIGGSGSIIQSSVTNNPGSVIGSPVIGGAGILNCGRDAIIVGGRGSVTFSSETVYDGDNPTIIGGTENTGVIYNYSQLPQIPPGSSGKIKYDSKTGAVIEMEWEPASTDSTASSECSCSCDCQ
jgi:hypothetical protein